MAGENRTEVIVDFRVNSVRIDPDFADNASRMREIVDFLHTLKRDSSVTVTSVAFCGAASPEGSYEWNRRLAAERLAALEDVIRSEVKIPDSIITRDDDYIPWDYLRRQLSGSDRDYKDAVLSIIDEPPELVIDPDNGKLVDRRIVLLKQLDGRRVWRDMLHRYFGKMRNASAVVITYDKGGGAAVRTCRVNGEVAEAEFAVEPVRFDMTQAAVSPSKPLCMALYSNMLYDALAVPNIGLEFYLGRNFSVAANWMHAWWSYDRRHRYWRIYGGEINGRYWFGRQAERKPLTGHHIGVYAQALTYDFEFGGKAYMGGKPGGTIFDRAHLGGGVEYGYSLPVAKRFNIDFTLGVGYIGGRVYEFVPDGDRYLWTATKNRNWFGPTKLEVSLVWLIGRGNVNAGKGGMP